jgi:hypothetical protein
MRLYGARIVWRDRNKACRSDGRIEDRSPPVGCRRCKSNPLRS